MEDWETGFPERSSNTFVSEAFGESDSISTRNISGGKRLSRGDFDETDFKRRVRSNVEINAGERWDSTEATELHSATEQRLFLLLSSQRMRVDKGNSSDRHWC